MFVVQASSLHSSDPIPMRRLEACTTIVGQRRHLSLNHDSREGGVTFPVVWGEPDF